MAGAGYPDAASFWIGDHVVAGRRAVLEAWERACARHRAFYKRERAAEAEELPV